ncbi:MAG: hypothetical protein GYA55_05455 [SAR324 cluster bacterium]|uniref:LysM domain-containing protein n=1 Tax=SAR324 cluster bacterium TaxID=2024889 RepID=A0A7X9FQV4_9DELT|nr:hypothetical protein [SAR324 cluster bacterium]
MNLKITVNQVLDQSHDVFIVILVSLFVSGCFSYSNLSNPALTRLKNRGPVLVSANNPYVASNLMLQKLMDESSEIKGFISHRGAPTVLEVNQSFFSAPTIMFYYPENGEYYRLENDNNFWLIQGPLSLSPEHRNQLLSLTQLPMDEEKSKSQEASTLEMEKGKTKEVIDKTEELKRSQSQTEKMMPLHQEPKEFPLKKTKDKGTIEKLKSSKSTPDKEIAAKTQSEVQKELDSESIRKITGLGQQSIGELTPKGDLVHYVTFADENLDLIAKWYTFDSKNAGKIARLSGISPKQALSVGDTLIIPSYLLKNKVRLNQEGMKILQGKQ